MQWPLRNLIDFPTVFRLRVIGYNANDFATYVMVRVRRFIPEVNEDNIQVRLSNGGKYCSVIVSFIAESEDQLQAIYENFTHDERVLFLI